MTDLTDEEIKETSEFIAEALQIMVDLGIENTDQLNMCHTCGNIIKNCTCEYCQCNMHKAYRKKWESQNNPTGMQK